MILSNSTNIFKKYYTINANNRTILLRLVQQEIAKPRTNSSITYKMEDNLSYIRKKILQYYADEYYRKHQDEYTDGRGIQELYCIIHHVDGIPLIIQFNEYYIFKIAIIDRNGKNFSWLPNWKKSFTKYFRK